MRHIFNALVDTTTSTTTTTTPTPCEKAIKAYKEHCNGALNNARKAVCKQRTAWFSVKGNGGKTQAQYEAAIKVVSDLLKIINTGKPKERKAAQDTLNALPSRGILENSVLADKAKGKAKKELADLKSAVEKIKGCNIAKDYVCKGDSTSCKKLINNNEERKNKRKNKMKNKPKNERKNKVKNKPKNERKNKVKNKPKNERKNKVKNKRKNEKKAERKALRKTERKAERKALRKNERKNESQSEE
jgi:hypothetical protein